MGQQLYIKFTFWSFGLFWNPVADRIERLAGPFTARGPPVDDHWFMPWHNFI